MKIAIQGGQASFHDMAVRKFFADQQIGLLECHTFRQVCAALVEREADLSVMAIENTLVGSILPNYTLLEEYPLRIVGETYLRIEHHIMALPGQSLSEIQSVRSHPMALMQCSNFLEAHPQIRGIETFDTAESAREIAEKQLRKTAAIASRLAAEKYNLKVISDNIENIEENYTRFLILSEAPIEDDETPDKASICFNLSHRPGSLAKALEVFHRHQINLTLIQSVPIIGKPNEYAFHIDLEWGDRKVFDAAIDELHHLTYGLKILGIYKRGLLPYEDSGSRQS
ncbi:MAG: prephenate dehydratase [Aliifodinibius sp.]|nr:prephenate dehydratase [candidate division Zixibacteria bacterium]NIT59175.1 prephenate dehydratase [Fodinibius sp.]NIS47351.1 prephenate dehydratase [candidate division Zixibacteria bacterium]NIU15709.1 prephenate dehydratase [candidate division Zixibacteria bacterium]NIV07559.1 prephenate dehydratase [candidate division Zixibacteria bacterium]